MVRLYVTVMDYSDCDIKQYENVYVDEYTSEAVMTWLLENTDYDDETMYYMFSDNEIPVYRLQGLADKGAKYIKQIPQASYTDTEENLIDLFLRDITGHEAMGPVCYSGYCLKRELMKNDHECMWVDDIIEQYEKDTEYENY